MNDMNDMNDMNNVNNVNNEENRNETASGAKFCPRCGKPLPENALFCGECGCNLNGPAPAESTPPAAPVQDTAPLKTIDYFLMLLLLCVPLVGLIVYIVWAFSGDTNVNRRNLSRAYLIYCLCGIALYIVLILLFVIIGITAASVIGDSAYYFGLIRPFF